MSRGCHVRPSKTATIGSAGPNNALAPRIPARHEGLCNGANSDNASIPTSTSPVINVGATYWNDKQFAKAEEALRFPPWERTEAQETELAAHALRFVAEGGGAYPESLEADAAIAPARSLGS